MKVQSINANYTNYNKQNYENSPSFSAMKMKQADLEKMIERNYLSEEGFQQLANTMRAKFNLKQVVDYANKSEREKAVLDSLFKKIGEDEVNDATVIIIPSEVDSKFLESKYGFYIKAPALDRYNNTVGLDVSHNSKDCYMDTSFLVPTPTVIEKYLKYILDHKVSSAISKEDREAEEAARKERNKAYFQDIKDLFV